MQTVIENIRSAFSQPLPGADAQYRMAHAVRGSYPQNVDTAKKAGVLLLLFPDAAAWHLVFIQRPSSNPDDHHSGQISFPGGKFEEGDSSIQYTALREAQEEVGVDPNVVKVLGHLSDLYIPVSDFLVSPVVGFTDQKPAWIPQQSEVAGIIEHPLVPLREEGLRGKTSIKLGRHLRLQQVPYFDLHGKVLWGATAMILNEFLEMKW